jgi:hypothetical protein
VRHIKNPISLARLVKDTTEHVLLVGQGAELFALNSGVTLIPTKDLIADFGDAPRSPMAPTHVHRKKRYEKDTTPSKTELMVYLFNITFPCIALGVLNSTLEPWELWLSTPEVRSVQLLQQVECQVRWKAELETLHLSDVVLWLMMRSLESVPPDGVKLSLSFELHPELLISSNGVNVLST